MVQIDLLRLRQCGTLTLAGSIGPDCELWSGSGLRFSGPVEVGGTAALTAGGGVVVQGSWRVPLVYECGRCLDDLQVAVERPLTLLFTPDGGREDPDVRMIDGRGTVLDLQDAIREEIVLEAPRYYTAGEEDGRCTRCGTPVKEYRSEPQEAGSDTDPRWAALKALQTDQEENDGGSQETGFQAAEAETPHAR